MGVVRERGFARELLSWRWEGALLTAEVSRARYVIRCERCEALAHAEIRDIGGSRRAEVGSFRSVGEARAACERHAAGLCVREAEPVPVDVRIAPVRRVAAKAGKGRELAAGNYRPRAPERSAGEALDAALAAFAGGSRGRRLVRDAPDVQAIFCRRRHQARRPPLAKIRPGRPAPAMGPGTRWIGGMGG